MIDIVWILMATILCQCLFKTSLTYRAVCILNADAILRTQITNASGYLFTSEALHAVAAIGVSLECFQKLS